MRIIKHKTKRLFILFAVFVVSSVYAVELPESRTDLMFHFYNGDDVQVNGPALLIREDMLDSFSAEASYYLDAVSSASVDVKSYASEYDDEREQFGLGINYLYKDALIGIGYTTSSERDYDANSIHVDVTHDTFGGLTKINLGYSRAWDEVTDVTERDFKENVNRNNYRVGLSQVWSPTFLMSFAYEGITDDGFLNSPYRAIRILNIFGGKERYPNTRTSHAVGFEGVKMLLRGRLRSTMSFGYRYFFDTWDITAHTFKLGYSQRLSDGLLMDIRFRYYDQKHASFYQDNFDQIFNFMARDKELSTFADVSVGTKLSYEIKKPFQFLDRASINVSFDLIRFDYEDFRDYSINQSSGIPFNFDAQVIQFFFSAWY